MYQERAPLLLMNALVVVGLASRPGYPR